MQAQCTQNRRTSPHGPTVQFVPAPLADRGVSVAHARPRSGPTFAALRRRAPERAWAHRIIEHNAPHTWNVLVVDVDDPLRWDDHPAPSWTVESTTRSHLHAAFVIKEPVVRPDIKAARAAPARFYRDVVEGMAARWGDARYQGDLTYSPLHDGATVTWGRTTPYTLVELREWLPDQAIPPTGAAATHTGRNVDTFTLLVTWASRNRDKIDERTIWRQAETINARWAIPLPNSEVGSISRSVTRYWRRWQAGDHSRSFINRQAALGRASGAARREAVAERDAAILAAQKRGLSVRAIAREHGIHHSTVVRALRRGVLTVRWGGARTKQDTQGLGT